MKQLVYTTWGNDKKTVQVMTTHIRFFEAVQDLKAHVVKKDYDTLHVDSNPWSFSIEFDKKKDCKKVREWIDSYNKKAA